MIEIDVLLCKGCEICIEMCPVDVFSQSDELSPKGYYLPKVESEDDCNYCRLCEKMCPEFAIHVVKVD